MIFLCFLSNLILIFLFLFILLLIFFFSNWNLFFNLIHYHLILILFFLLNSFIILMIVIPVIFSSLIDFFFSQFHQSLFNFIGFSFHIWCLFFYHAFKTRPRSRPPSSPESWVGSSDQGYQGQSSFLFCRK